MHQRDIVPAGRLPARVPYGQIGPEQAIRRILGTLVAANLKPIEPEGIRDWDHDGGFPTLRLTACT